MRVKIEKLDNYGRGITYLNNKICFVENSLPNELVEIEIIKEKAKYLEAKVINYIEVSKDRIDPLCPYYDKCGGCNLRHLDYQKENIWKEEKVQAILKHIGNIDIKVNNIIYGNESNYRNKVTLHNSNNRIGYYSKGTNDILEIDECLLLDNKINEVINIGSKKYYLSRDSFFQINRFITKDLFDIIRKSINKKYHTCLDLYCGTGTIGIYIADLVNKVIGIDNNKSNINDANDNIKLNNINNIEFICSNVEDKIEEFTNIDLIIVDPPRSGLDSKTKKYLEKINPERIIYVSCDPITLARDLKDLNNNYNVLEVTPVNMFPRTYHCETIAVLERIKCYE